MKVHFKIKVWLQINMEAFILLADLDIHNFAIRSFEYYSQVYLEYNPCF